MKHSQFAGSCRFMWNRMLTDINAGYEAGEKYSCPTPAKYKKVPGLEWLKEILLPELWQPHGQRPSGGN
jgi:hypothetical protein